LGSIFIETYFVFTSIWNYKVYYVYGFFLLVFLILIIVTLCVTIVGKAVQIETSCNPS
jgi:transmembrane 9 superfamily protein 3